MSRDGGEFPPKFEEMVMTADGDVDVSYRAIRTSLYFKFLPNWLEHFPRDQIHIVDGENLVSTCYFF